MKVSSHRLFMGICLVGLAATWAAAAPLGTSFTYQGQINQGGSPLDGSADFQISLYDAASGGAPVGATLSINNVTVSAGVFAALLDFGVDVFNGDARFLEIALRSPAGSGSYTTLSPRVSITATPYALQTRGIFVNDAGDVSIGVQEGAFAGSSLLDGPKMHVQGIGTTGLLAETSAMTGVVEGVRGKTVSTSGRGVVGEALGTTGQTQGVYGKSESSAGEGVRGEGATGISGVSDDTGGKGVVGVATGDGSAVGVQGTSVGGEGVHGGGVIGVCGVSDDASGTGVVGVATGDSSSVGVQGTSLDGEGVHGGGVIGVCGVSSDVSGTGVVGVATGDSSSTGVEGTSLAGHGVHGDGTTGVCGVSDDVGGTGVLGEVTGTDGTAVAGVAADSIGNNIGVYGKTNSPIGFAGYFEGRSYVSDRLGIGTDAPTAKLHIGGLAGTDGIRFPDGTLQTTAGTPDGSQWLHNASDLYYNGGNVGVGTNTPTAKIDAVQSSGIAIKGASAGALATAVSGSATGPGVTIGVQGTSASPTGEGVRGTGATGVRGTSSTANGRGVVGDATGTGASIGVQGTSTTGYGVQGTGQIGVFASSSSEGGSGVWGTATAPGFATGVLGTSMGVTGVGVQGSGNTGVSGTGEIGVQGEGDTFGVNGKSTDLSGGTGVRGEGYQYGVHGIMTGASPGAGVLAEGSPNSDDAALEIRSGGIRVSGGAPIERPAGTIEFNASSVSWSVLASCIASTHSHTIGYTTQRTLPSTLITEDSIILLTVEAAQPGFAFSAHVESKILGSAQIVVSRIASGGSPTCALPAGITIRVHYLIIDPA